MRMTILLAALAIVESGDKLHPAGNDRAIGKAREVSRYQITPAVWKKYAAPGYRPSNPVNAYWTASTIITARTIDHCAITGETDPEPAVIYALWHRPCLFAKRGYNLNRMPKVVQARCQRFAAVCQDLEKKDGK